MQDVRTGRMRLLPSDGPRLRRKRVASATSLGLREHDKAETRRSHGHKPWGAAIWHSILARSWQRACSQRRTSTDVTEVG